ncbi:RNA-guided endonuclease IscB [Vreelandella rituensis]|uniref:Restriction endonuclease n=1 Tax=Vreelandella rituensis TaxID=2282306 RepID=A0A368U7S8_9GAMM|nr:RNA-guided endonuclease IscB [Halomonas rituensis]RCV93004.1 restriction endonuclease [Halomonas rituensis]
MRVYVKSQQGDWLMPTHPAKARWMLRLGKAQVIRRTPFAIQLTYAATEHGQPVVLGIDDGNVVVGIAAVANDEVVYQEEIHLRTDIKIKMDTRRSYRQGRRHRKTRYRTPRFDNRSASHKKGRLPPSIRSKKGAILRAVAQMPLPAPALIRLEDAYFDIQAIENPDITGTAYQQGPLLYDKNVKSACKTRDKHRCRVCSTEDYLQVHHLIHRTNGGSDKLSNLMTLCRDCHDDHHKNGLVLPRQKNVSFRSAAHVQQGKYYLQAQLETLAPVQTTFGYLTAHHRKHQGIDKIHANDAVVIAQVGVLPKSILIKTICLGGRKRSLHEATPRRGRKQSNREQKRNGKNVVSLKGFKRLDTVRFQGQVGYLSGFNGTSMAFVRGKDGRYITSPGKSYKQVSLSTLERLHHNQTRVRFLVKQTLTTSRPSSHASLADAPLRRGNPAACLLNLNWITPA